MKDPHGYRGTEWVTKLRAPKKCGQEKWHINSMAQKVRTTCNKNVTKEENIQRDEFATNNEHRAVCMCVSVTERSGMGWGWGQRPMCVREGEREERGGDRRETDREERGGRERGGRREREKREREETESERERDAAIKQTSITVIFCTRQMVYERNH